MDEKINLENIGWVRFNWSSSKDNLTYEDEEIAIEELGHYKKSGGQTIAQYCTNSSVGSFFFRTGAFSSHQVYGMVC